MIKMNRPPGQIDAFVSSDEGSDMDVSDSETDEPTISQSLPFIAVAPSDYNKPGHIPKAGSFVRNIRNYAAEQAQDLSNRIIAPRVEHFNNESDPIQVDSDSDESTSSFHTAPSSPAEESNINDELELEMAKLAETIQNNNKLIGELKTEVTELNKKKEELNQKILRNKVRNSITKKRTIPREIPKLPVANHVQPVVESSKKHDNRLVGNTPIVANKTKGKQKVYISQQQQLHPNSKKAIKKMNKNLKKANNLAMKTKQKLERNKNTKEINKIAAEIAEHMNLEKPPSPPPTLQDIQMEEGELLDSSDGDKSSSNLDNSTKGNIINSNGNNHDFVPFVQTTPKNLGHIPKIIKNQTFPMQHTTNRNNFQPYKSALSSIGLSAQSRPKDSGIEDRPLCTFEQNGGTCNNDSCQAAHFRDFI